MPTTVKRYTAPATASPGFGLGDFSAFGGGSANSVTRYPASPTPSPAPAPTPAPAPAVIPPAPVVEPQATTPALPAALMTQDQFSANRTGTVDENAIREQTRKNMQAQIDATDKYYADLVSRENQAGSDRLAKVQ